MSLFRYVALSICRSFERLPYMHFGLPGRSILSVFAPQVFWLCYSSVQKFRSCGPLYLEPSSVGTIASAPQTSSSSVSERKRQRVTESETEIQIQIQIQIDTDTKTDRETETQGQTDK